MTVKNIYSQKEQLTSFFFSMRNSFIDNKSWITWDTFQSMSLSQREKKLSQNRQQKKFNCLKLSSYPAFSSWMWTIICVISHHIKFSLVAKSNKKNVKQRIWMKNAWSFNFVFCHLAFFYEVAASEASLSNGIYAISTLINFRNDTAPFEWRQGNRKSKCLRYHKLYDEHREAWK